MFGVFKKSFGFMVLLGAFMVGAIGKMPVAMAEGDALCSGLITGTTIDGGNAGRNYFDAHGGPNQGVNAQFYNNIVNLAVFGLGQGLAPGSRANAACVEKESGVAYGEAYEYKLKGYVVNSNLGFISFNCEGGFNDAGEGNGVACGAFDYGVYISPVNEAYGTRKLFGYAWNPAFGYITFNPLPLNWEPGDPQPGDIVYDVDMNAQGQLFGKAWSDAQVYMPFNGAKIFLPDEEIPVPVVNTPENWCDNKPYLCVMVDPYPEKLKFGFEEPVVPVGEEMKVADGVDGYNVHLYLRNATGDGPLDPAQYNFDAFTNSIRLSWTDTVKIDQTSLVQVDNSARRMPWTSGTGAVVNKPLNFSDFAPVPGDPGHYVSIKMVSSFAPTTDGNVSVTTSTDPKFAFKNEQFVQDVGVGTVQPNNLVLNSITFNDLIANVGMVTVLSAGAVYPNGKVGMSMKFRAPVEVNTLYADDFQDKIVAYRSIPMNFRIGAKSWGGLAVLNSAKVDFKLAYATQETRNQDLCAGLGENQTTFDFHFISDLAGFVLPDTSGPGVSTVKEFLNVTASTLFNVEKDVQANATLPVGVESPCANVVAPTLYTVVRYSPAVGKEVKFYGNKLPRLSGDMIANPTVVVHGNVFSQMVNEIRKDVLVQTSGSVNVNIVRDTINENLEKYLTSQPAATDKLCTITALNADGTATVIGGINGCTVANNDYKKLVIGNENVLYFRGKKVAIDLQNGAYAGKWVIVSADGNIFVDRNIYNAQENAANSVSLVAFRSTKRDVVTGDEFFRTGNIYFAPCSNGLKNIQATVIADGSVFSYNGVKIFGVPGQIGVSIDSATGEPVWGNYANMVGGLGCQLLIEGSIYSDNTIGGADLDKGEDPKDYLLAGGGKVIKLPATLADRMRAQSYDLNYLRMFRLHIETTVDGLPLDQQCGKGLTNDEIRRVKVGEIICGEIEPCEPGDINSENVCDGIDPFNPVSDGGDLVAPRDSGALAVGLQNDVVSGTQFDPVYVYYKAPAKDSFIFSKPGVIDVGGR